MYRFSLQDFFFDQNWMLSGHRLVVGRPWYFLCVIIVASWKLLKVFARFVKFLSKLIFPQNSLNLSRLPAKLIGKDIEGELIILQTNGMFLEREKKKEGSYHVT